MFTIPAYPSVFEFDKGLQYGIKSSGVWHRYSEFDLLYQYLLHTYPSHIIPPLPEKKVHYIHMILLYLKKFNITIGLNNITIGLNNERFER